MSAPVGTGGIPPLRGPTRHSSARRKKSGRSGRDDRIWESGQRPATRRQEKSKREAGEEEGSLHSAARRAIVRREGRNRAAPVGMTEFGRVVSDQRPGDKRKARERRGRKRIPPLRGPTRHSSARKKNRAAPVGMTEFGRVVSDQRPGDKRKAKERRGGRGILHSAARRAIVRREGRNRAAPVGMTDLGRVVSDQRSGGRRGGPIGRLAFPGGRDDNGHCCAVTPFQEGDEMQGAANEQRKRKRVQRHFAGPLGDGEPAIREARFPFLAALIVVRQTHAMGTVATQSMNCSVLKSKRFR